jgi:protein-S-isoprenylcysteine O-methyltransferase Ste14
MHWLNHKIPPPVIAALIALGMWGASKLGTGFQLAQEWRQVMVALLVFAGVGIDLSGLWVFRAARTTLNPLSPDKASALVTGGVYRITRNPMYLGMVLILLAWALHLSVWLAFAGPVVFVLYITRFQIQPEERVLATLFGDEYAAYCARVRRWL